MASSWNSYHETWSQYVSRKTVTDDLVGGIGSELERVLFRGQGTNLSMVAGINQMNDGIAQLDRVIDSLGARFEWGMSNLLAEMGGMKDSLDSLIQISRTPVQTWAYNQFEIARDAFRQGLYLEALESVQTAINGNAASPGYKLEWRFHNMKGLIQLGFYGCDPDLINVSEAEKSFLLAARYAKVDSPSDSSRALLSASWCAYTQKKLPEALDYSRQASVLDPSLAEAFFQMAKVGMALGQVNDALPMLRGAIRRDDGYVIKAAADSDFNRHNDELVTFFQALQNESLSNIRRRVGAMFDEMKQWPEALVRAADQTEITDRWHSVLNDDWGLVQLLKYEPLVDGEIEQVRTAYLQVCQRQEELERERLEGLERLRQERERRERLELERLEREQADVEAKFIARLDCLLGLAVTVEQVRRVAMMAEAGKQGFVERFSKTVVASEWETFGTRKAPSGIPPVVDVGRRIVAGNLGFPHTPQCRV